MSHYKQAHDNIEKRNLDARVSAGPNRKATLNNFILMVQQLLGPDHPCQVVHVGTKNPTEAVVSHVRTRHVSTAQRALEAVYAGLKSDSLTERDLYGYITMLAILLTEGKIHYEGTPLEGFHNGSDQLPTDWLENMKFLSMQWNVRDHDQLLKEAA